MGGLILPMTCFRGQIAVYKDQVRQFSKTIVQLEKNLKDEQEKLLKLQSDNSKPSKKAASPPPHPPPPTSVVPVIPVLAAHVADFR